MEIGDLEGDGQNIFRVDRLGDGKNDAPGSVLPDLPCLVFCHPAHGRHQGVVDVETIGTGQKIEMEACHGAGLQSGFDTKAVGGKPLTREIFPIDGIGRPVGRNLSEEVGIPLFEGCRLNLSNEIGVPLCEY